MDTISNIPKKIFNFFTKTAEKLASESQFKIRSSKVAPKSFVKALLKTCFSQQLDLEKFLCALKTEGVIIRKQSLFDRFNDRTVQFLRSLALEGLKHFKTEKLPHLARLEQFTAVNIIDSSTISLNRELNTLFKGCGGSASSAAIKIQLMFDYLSGQIQDLALTSGCKNDQGFDAFLNSIQKGALYLMDLGYFKLNSFKKIIEGEAFFVSRLLTGTKILTEQGEELDLVQTLPKSSLAHSQRVLLGVKAKIPVRLVTQRLPQELADRRRQKLKEGHRRQGITPSKESLALQSWSIYITNTDEAQISDADIHSIYAYRWQIELLFKLSKSLMKIDSINTVKSYRVLIEIYGKFICMMLLFLLCAPVRLLQNKEISFYKACKLLMDKASELILALNSLYRLKRFITEFCGDLTLFAIKDIKKKKAPPVETSLESDF